MIFISSLPYIPVFITVHLGAPDENVPNETVTFPDYIKNVASSEIYPTWPEEALKANILAQISYALNRVYTEYYRSRGYDFDITSITQYDQFYVSGRNIFENIEHLVDDFFNNYIRRTGTIEPLFAQYCNGTTTQCAGMSQWGSYELARQGLSYLQILYRYYGDDIEIVTNTPVQAIIPTYPQRPLQLGNISNETRSIQVRLNRISTNYPNIPKINPVNGIFSIDTENAVITFQNTFNLVVDGIVGKATWYKIQYVYYAVKRVCELASEGVLYDDVSKQYPDYLLAGNRGPEVAQVQYFLNFVSQYENNVSPVLVDGIFGPATEKSVRDFQRLYNLNVDGIVGPDTFNTLYDVYIGIVRSLPDNIFINQARPFQGRNLLLGSEGEDVGYLQDYINYISGVYPEIPPVVRDSIFDENTLAAVLALEEHLGLPADGIIDAAAWNEIASLYDDLHTDTHVNLGQYPGYEISQQLSGG